MMNKLTWRTTNEGGMTTTMPAPVSTTASNCLQDGRQGLMDNKGQTLGTATDTHPCHCEQLLTWGIMGANGHKNTAENGEGTAQHLPPTTVGICLQGGPGANRHVTTNRTHVPSTEHEQEPSQQWQGGGMMGGWSITWHWWQHSEGMTMGRGTMLCVSQCNAMLPPDVTWW